ncbi:unnamed protein product [Brassica napus]|uniref:(rape) hypothetical protein n=1 Tax=Brassica napus TaxID=3708 RepID=A0A816JMP1_BRANA|nr:unnamed protein product [Brassica napus]
MVGMEGALMGQECDAWCWYLEDVYLLHTPHEPDWVRPKHGFDVDWTKARCLYTYHPVEFDDDDFVDEPGAETNPETNLDLLNRLFKDPVANLEKDFQARIHYSYCSKSQFIMCRPKHHQADSLGVDESDRPQETKTGVGFSLYL